MIEMNAAVTNESITQGADVNWHHIDGPLMYWAGHMHWLTFRERLRLFFGLASVDQIACERWPWLMMARAKLLKAARSQSPDEEPKATPSAQQVDQPA